MVMEEKINYLRNIHTSQLSNELRKLTNELQLLISLHSLELKKYFFSIVQLLNRSIERFNYDENFNYGDRLSKLVACLAIY